MKTDGKNKKISLPGLMVAGDKGYNACLILGRVVITLLFFFTSHPDLWETANHSYVFLESLFSGKAMDFYRVVAAHENSYYYINYANYNIMVYVLFGLVELPVFLFNRIFGLAMNEAFIIYWAKIVSVGFFIGCAAVINKVAVAAGMGEKTTRWAAVFFLLNPIALYSAVAMGQYDGICLFFILLGLYYWLEGDMAKASLVFGAGAVFKFFPLLIFLPLLLLAEKKIINLIKYLALSMWLYIPTTILYMGRTGNAAVFTKMMAERLLAYEISAGRSRAPVFLLAYAAVLFTCFVYCPGEKEKKYRGLYLPLAVFALMFIVMEWHPQWVILVCPFIILTTLKSSATLPWHMLEIVLRAGYFGLAFFAFPNRAGSALFGGGVLAHVAGVNFAVVQRYVSFFLGLLPWAKQLAATCFDGALLCNILLKMPVGGRPLADRLTKRESYDNIPLPAAAIAVFAIGFVCCWLVPAVFEALNRLGVI